MITLRNLTASPNEEPAPAVGPEQVVLDEHNGGDPPRVWYRVAGITPTALILRANGKGAICLPMAELWKLAEQFEPGLIPPFQHSGH